MGAESDLTFKICMRFSKFICNTFNLKMSCPDIVWAYIFVQDRDVEHSNNFQLMHTRTRL